MTQHSPDVAIIGGGMIGCACAWALARAGVSVSVYERGRLAGEASGAAAGILAPLAESSTPGPFADLAVAGLLAYADEIGPLMQESGIDPEYWQSGVLRLALTAEDATRLRSLAGWQGGHGVGLRWLDAVDVRALEPALAPAHGALYSEDEGQVRPPLLARARATAAARRGVRFREYVEHAEPVIEEGRAVGVRLTNGAVEAAGAVLVAGGVWSSALLNGALGVALRPVKGQYALLHLLPRPLRHVVFAGHGYLVPRRDGSLYAGATEEDAGFDRRVTAGGLADVLGIARAIVPATANAEVLGSGAGLRPGSADGLPVIGPVPGVQGLYAAAGHFRNGVLMCLVTARLVAAHILGGEPPLSPAPYLPGRVLAQPVESPGRGHANR
jgi:glycine oxidase